VTALPYAGVSPAPFTVARYAALGEEDDRLQTRFELQEGSIVVGPSARADHQMAMGRLIRQLHEQLPANVALLHAIDVDLQLVPPDAPGFVRRPDLIVIRADALERLRATDELVTAADVILVVEILAPTSVRTDTVIKRGEYADAGIPYYWIVDITAPASLTACHRTEEFGYQDPGAVTGEFRAIEPFPVQIDLTKLG